MTSISVSPPSFSHRFRTMSVSRNVDPEQHDARQHPPGKAVDPEVLQDRRLVLDQLAAVRRDEWFGLVARRFLHHRPERTHRPCHDGQMPSDAIRDWLADQVRSRVVGTSAPERAG